MTSAANRRAIARETRPSRVTNWDATLGIAVGATVALGFYAVAGAEPAAVAYVALFGPVLVLLAWTDIRSRTIPNAITYPAILLAAGLSLLWPGHDLVESLSGGVCALAVTSVIRTLSRGGLGGGDVKMAGLVGVAVGFPGVLSAAAFAAISGGIAGGLLLAARIIGKDDELPYGPFIALGAVAALIH